MPGEVPGVLLLPIPVVLPVPIPVVPVPMPAVPELVVPGEVVVPGDDEAPGEAVPAAEPADEPPPADPPPAPAANAAGPDTARAVADMIVVSFMRSFLHSLSEGQRARPASVPAWPITIDDR